MMRTAERKMRTMEEIIRKTLLRFKNFWYFVALAVHVPKDNVLAPL